LPGRVIAGNRTPPPRREKRGAMKVNGKAMRKSLTSPSWGGENALRVFRVGGTAPAHRPHPARTPCLLHVALQVADLPTRGGKIGVGRCAHCQCANCRYRARACRGGSGRHYMVGGEPYAVDAGLQMLRAAARRSTRRLRSSVLTLVEPESSGIGGGAFLLLYDPTSRK